MAAARIRTAQHTKSRRATLAPNFACEFCLRLFSALDGYEVLFMKEINYASLRNTGSVTQISQTLNTQNRRLAFAAVVAPLAADEIFTSWKSVVRARLRNYGTTGNK
uniref:Uncharacterized protein n=1 Tax=Ascaris lumbricoides TaxID=6252 RepID=A0A0M3HKT3_ASCLU